MIDDMGLEIEQTLRAAQAPGLCVRGMDSFDDPSSFELLVGILSLDLDHAFHSSFAGFHRQEQCARWEAASRDCA
jgi:hypothetical protein